MINASPWTVRAARLAFGAGLFAVMASVVAPARSATAPVRISHEDANGRVTLRVNNVPVATLVRSGKSSGAERAAIVESRLSGWAASNEPLRVAVSKVDGVYSVFVDGGIVLTPSHEDAVRAGLSRRAVAHQWAARLISAWNTPFLYLSPGGVTVAVGNNRWLRVGGGARGPVEVRVEPSVHASARVVKDSMILLSGLRPGRATVTVTRDGASASSALLVMQPAGTVRRVSIEVTGKAIPGDLLETVTDAEVRRAIRLEPGAWSVIKSRPTFPAVWTRGDHLHYTMPIRLAGPNYLPVQTNLDIRITRRRLSRPKDVALFYSNHPETVKAPQILFWHGLTEQTPARLLYHHQNMGTQPLNMAVDLANDGATDVPVHIVDGTAPPSVDTVLAGHLAAYKFLKRTQNDVGIIVTVPAHGRRRIFVRRLDPGDTLSGLMLVRPLSDGHLTLSMRAESVDRPAVRFAASPAETETETETVFPSPDKTLDATYTVGGAWTYIPIGRYPVSNDAGVRLDGNYGVLYTVRLKLVNPTTEQQVVNVLFEPRAGEARAVFVINGALTETPSTFPPSETPVMTVKLTPRETRSVTMVTMPAAGGAYPAALIVHG